MGDFNPLADEGERTKGSNMINDPDISDLKTVGDVIDEVKRLRQLITHDGLASSVMAAFRSWPHHDLDQAECDADALGAHLYGYLMSGRKRS